MKIKITLSIITVSLLAFLLGINALPERVIEFDPIIAKRKAEVVPKIELPEFKDMMPPIDQLSELTQKIIGFDPDLSTRQRNKLVWQLRKSKLTKIDFEALFVFLKQNPTEPGNQLSWHSLKNDLLVILIDDGRYKELMAQLMNDIINDDLQHSVMREYVLQYTSDYFERHWLDKLSSKEIGNYSNVDRAQQNKMLETMYNALNWPEGPIAGTSLIKLHDISQKFSCVDQHRIDQETKRLVLDSSISESSRMAAFSIAAERNLNGLEKEVANIAFDSNSKVILRMTALNALIQLTPKESTLERINSEILNDESCDKRLLKAAKMSLKKILKEKG